MADAPHTSTDVPSRQGKVQLAVFDYDGTCITGQSGALFSVYLFRHGYIGVGRSLALGWWGLRYKLHLPYRQDEARELIFKELSRYSVQDVARIMTDFHDEMLIPRYRKSAIQEVAKRKAEGCVTLLVSATFEPIARCAQHVLNVDGVIATEMAVDDRGHFTGKVEDDVVQGEQKPLAAARWADREFGPGAWEIAYAYGDHFSDAEMLAAAGQGFAVTPDKTLAALAKREGYPILDWK